MKRHHKGGLAAHAHAFKKAKRHSKRSRRHGGRHKKG
jgi:hypothetical protein